MTSPAVEPSSGPSGTAQQPFVNDLIDFGTSSLLFVPLASSTKTNFFEAANVSLDNQLFSTAEGSVLDTSGNNIAGEPSERSIPIVIETAGRGTSSSFTSSVRPKFRVSVDSDFSAKLNFSSTDDDDDNSGRARNLSPSSGDVDKTEDGNDVTVVSATGAALASDETDSDKTDRRSDKATQASFSSSSSSSSGSCSVQSVVEAQSTSSSTGTLTDAQLSNSQNLDSEHQDPEGAPTASPTSAPASPTGRRQSPSAFRVPPHSASLRSENMKRWLKGQGIDPANIVEGKRLRKPKKS